MLLKSEFKVDLFQLKHTKDPEGLLTAMKQANAVELGRKLIELLPYKKIAGYEGELPEMSLNREHEFTDTYSVELVVLDAIWVRQQIKKFEGDAEEFTQEYNDECGSDVCLAKAEILKQLLL